MPENNALPQLQAVRLRIAKLEPVSGIPLPGAHNLYVTDAFVKVGFSPVYKDGAEIEQENAQGGVCAYTKGDDTFKRGDVSIQVCSADPYLTTLLSGGTVLSAFDGDRVGMAAPALGTIGNASISVEVWTKRVDDGDLDQSSPYAWWAYPKIKNLRQDAHEHGNSAFTPTFTGQAYENAGWTDGPLNDWPAASDRVYQWVPTDTLPAVSGSATLAAS